VDRSPNVSPSNIGSYSSGKSQQVWINSRVANSEKSGHGPETAFAEMRTTFDGTSLPRSGPEHFPSASRLRLKRQSQSPPHSIGKH
jgi:hypothetical protein